MADSQLQHDTEEIYQRITRLEATQSEMSKQLGEVVSAVRGLSSEFQASRRPQWQLLIAMLGVLIGLGGAGASILLLVSRGQIAPVELRVSSAQATLAEHSGRLDRIWQQAIEARGLADRLETQQREKFAEVETQFLSLSNQTNMRQSEHDRILRLLWRRAYNEELPGNGIWPVVGKQSP